MFINDMLVLANEDKRRKEKAKTVQNIAIGIGVGVALGVIVGILYAPKSGKETREFLKNKAADTLDSIKDSLKENAEMVKDTALDIADNVSDNAKDASKKIKT